MRKHILLLSLLIIGSISAFSQFQPNNGYGPQLKRAKIDTLIMLPTGCGAPGFFKTYSANDSSMAALRFDSCGHKWYSWDPALKAWEVLGIGNADSLNHQLAAYYLARANHTGTQAQITIVALTDSLINKVSRDGSYTNPSWITNLPWSKITATPTTKVGYGITDVVAYSDTSLMLAPLLRKSDSASMLSALTIDRVLLNGNTSGRNVTVNNANTQNIVVGNTGPFGGLTVNDSSAIFLQLHSNHAQSSGIAQRQLGTDSIFLGSTTDPTILLGTYLSNFGNTGKSRLTIPSGWGTLALTSDLLAYVDLTSNQTIAGTKTFSGFGRFNATLGIYANGFTGYLSAPFLSSDLTWTFPTSTGTLALTSDLATKANLSGATFTGNVILNADPTTAFGAATKNYVDNVSAGLFWKPAAKAATTANIALTGTQTVDGIALVSGDTVLVKNQTTGTQNGYYIVAAGAWARASWGTTGTQLWGSAAFVKNGGTVNGGTQWTNSNSTQPTVDTDAITFAQIAGAGVYTNGTYLSLTGNVFDVNSTYAVQWNAAYTNRIASLTTTGNNGAATLAGNVLNIPAYTLAGLGGITLSSLSAGVGISYNNTTGVITNSAPDQTVGLTNGAGISVTGAYPNFTIASTITQYTDALARASLSFVAGSGAYNSVTGVITIPTNNNQIANGAGFLNANQAIVVTATGDATGTSTSSGTAPSLPLVVGKINGVSLAGLATGILKNTTTTGVPSIAIASDFPVFNQNTTGNAATTSQTNFTNLTIGGSQVLDAANYNSYAPTLTGAGASGTWGINITGNSATSSNSTLWNGVTYGGPYLPISAGSGNAVTGQLWINNSSQSFLALNFTGTTAWNASISTYNNIFAIYDETAGRSIMNYTRSTTTVSFGGSVTGLSGSFANGLGIPNTDAANYSTLQMSNNLGKDQQFFVFGSARADVYFGQTAANWAVNYTTTANGMMIGTYNATSFIIGTNNTAAITISNSQYTTFAAGGSFSGTLTAPSLIKSGGTGLNLLVDDGTTIPKSTYLTSTNNFSGYYLPDRIDSVNCNIILNDSLSYSIIGNGETGIITIGGSVKINATAPGDVAVVLSLPSYITGYINHGGGSGSTGSIQTSASISQNGSNKRYFLLNANVTSAGIVRYYYSAIFYYSSINY